MLSSRRAQSSSSRRRRDGMNDGGADLTSAKAAPTFGAYPVLTSCSAYVSRPCSTQMEHWTITRDRDRD